MEGFKLVKTSSDIRSFFMDNTSPELDIAWNNLYRQYENHQSPSGELWQYMGTWETEKGWMHQFRHRSYYGERKYVDITPTDKFKIT